MTALADSWKEHQSGRTPNLSSLPTSTSSTGVRHTFRFLVFAFWFSILPLVFDSVFFQIFPALPTVPWGPGVPSQAPKLQNFNFLTYTCEPVVIVPESTSARCQRVRPKHTPIPGHSLLDSLEVESDLKLVTDISNSCAALTCFSVWTAGNSISRGGRPTSA